MWAKSHQNILDPAKNMRCNFPVNTINRPTINQLIDAPIGARLLVWVNKDEFLAHPETPDRLAVKTAFSANGSDQWQGIGKARSSSEFRISVWYKVKLVTEN